MPYPFLIFVIGMFFLTVSVFIKGFDMLAWIGIASMTYGILGKE